MKLIHAPKADKKQQLLRLLQHGTVMIFVDTRRSDVAVPTQHKDNPQLPLNLDYSFQIPDFEILDDRIQASLSFNRQRFLCVLPWEAIYGMNSRFTGEAVIFPESIPSDLAKATGVVPSPSSEPVAPDTKESKSTKKFIVVSNPQIIDANSTNDQPPIPTEPKPSKKRGHLKLVE